MNVESYVREKLAAAFLRAEDAYFGPRSMEPLGPHEHEWEAAYVLERLVGDQTGDARVWSCLPCGETREYSDGKRP